MNPSMVNVANDAVVTEARLTHAINQKSTAIMVMMPSVIWAVLVTLSPLSNAKTDVLVSFYKAVDVC